MPFLTLEGPSDSGDPYIISPPGLCAYLASRPSQHRCPHPHAFVRAVPLLGHLPFQFADNSIQTIFTICSLVFAVFQHGWTPLSSAYTPHVML